MSVLSFGVLATLLVLSFLSLDKSAQGADLVVLVFLEVKRVLLSKSQLQKVVIEGLFGYVHFGRCVFQRVPHKISVSQDSIIKSAP